jgi:hypothetical protein
MNCLPQASGERVNLTIARPGKPQPSNGSREAGAHSSSNHAQPPSHSRPGSHKVRGGSLLQPLWPSKDHRYPEKGVSVGLVYACQSQHNVKSGLFGFVWLVGFCLFFCFKPEMQAVILLGV